jgi:hypothetical protein
MSEETKAIRRRLEAAQEVTGTASLAAIVYDGSLLADARFLLAENERQAGEIERLTEFEAKADLSGESIMLCRANIKEATGITAAFFDDAVSMVLLRLADAEAALSTARDDRAEIERLRAEADATHEQGAADERAAILAYLRVGVMQFAAAEKAQKSPNAAASYRAMARCLVGVIEQIGSGIHAAEVPRG